MWREGSYLGSVAQTFPVKALGVTAAAGGRPRWAQCSMLPTAVAGVRTRVPGVWVYLEKVPHSHHFPRGKLSSGAGPEEQRRGAARSHGNHRRNIIEKEESLQTSNSLYLRKVLASLCQPLWIGQWPAGKLSGKLMLCFHKEEYIELPMPSPPPLFLQRFRINERNRVVPQCNRLLALCPLRHSNSCLVCSRAEVE